MKKHLHVTHTEVVFGRYTFILLMSIFSAQFMTAVIVENLHLIAPNHYLSLKVFFYVFTCFAAIPQAGFSDDFGRKRHLLYASCYVLFSAILMLTIVFFQVPESNLSKNALYLVSAIPIGLLGIAGNAIDLAPFFGPLKVRGSG